MLKDFPDSFSGEVKCSNSCKKLFHNLQQMIEVCGMFFKVASIPQNIKCVRVPYLIDVFLFHIIKTNV